MIHAVNSLTDAVAQLQASEKFRDWNKLLPADLNPKLSPDDKHFKPEDLAEAWGVSTETIRAIFRQEPGVLKIGSTGTRHKRGYITLRIPKEVAERVHRRLSA